MAQQRRGKSFLLLFFKKEVLLLLYLPCCSAQAETCFETLAQTRNYSLGQPTHAQPSPDGTSAFYLRSGPRDTGLHLYEFDSHTAAERELAAPATARETLSTEEKARRERARMTLTGITDFAVSEDGASLLATEADRLEMVTLPGGTATRLPGRDWIAPRLSPDGRLVAAVRDGDLHVIEDATGHDTQLTTGGTATLTRGLAEFAAAEELGRADGAWWSPDSSQLVYEEADTAGVEHHYIADPIHPDRPPADFRYPRAGTPNAETRLGIVASAGGPTTWIAWDRKALPYIARVIWPRQGKLSLVLLDRAQQREAVLAVDPANGHTSTLLEEHDPAWINIEPMFSPRLSGLDLPHWLDDGSGFLWASEATGTWQLELRHADGSLDHAVTPDGFRFDALDDADTATGDVVVTASPDPTSFGLYRVRLSGGNPEALAASPGLHNAVFAEGRHDTLIERYSTADGQAGTRLLRRDGSQLASLPSTAEQPPRIPSVQYLQAGPRQLDAQIIRPSDAQQGRRYPVILSVYAGPGVKNVIRQPRAAVADQCLADRGFVVVTMDARGTPGRDHDFERATRGNLIDAPLADQVEGLQALGAQFPEMDMAHVGVEGWSFGGYFSAMATIRRPDIFEAGAAGAPVVDFADYDTAYTERYLGLPAENPGAYTASNVLTHAAELARPLLIMHGLTDDNVYFQNTVKLTQALFAAGKRYQLLLLPGTHLLPDPRLRAQVDETRAAFLKTELAK